MTDQPHHIRETVDRVLMRIAPEADLASLDPSEPLRGQLDIDSFDFLRFVVGLHESLGVDIPESDYPRLITMNDSLVYLREALDSSPSTTHTDSHGEMQGRKAHGQKSGTD
jgi:acyl carrier protein